MMVVWSVHITKLHLAKRWERFAPLSDSEGPQSVKHITIICWNGSSRQGLLSQGMKQNLCCGPSHRLLFQSRAGSIKSLYLISHLRMAIVSFSHSCQHNFNQCFCCFSQLTCSLICLALVASEQIFFWGPSSSWHWTICCACWNPFDKNRSYFFPCPDFLLQDSSVLACNV